VPQAIKAFRDAGVFVRMITEDNVGLARLMAIKSGIIEPESEFLCMDSTEFNSIIRDRNGRVVQEKMDQVRV
jgi:magnesium-transporting ATPase (P-type)